MTWQFEDEEVTVIWDWPKVVESYWAAVERMKLKSRTVFRSLEEPRDN